MEEQGDALLYQTNDNGEIAIEGGLVTMSGGLETSAYLSLFGGNEQDDGRKDGPLQYWGNLLDPTEPSKQYRSETQYLLRSIPSIPANLRRIEDAARRDLQWMLVEKVATSLSISVTMPGLNKVRIVIDIQANGGLSEIEFTENWKVDSQ